MSVNIINGIESNGADDGEGAWLRNVGLWPIIDAVGRAKKNRRNVDTSLKAQSQIEKTGY
jgi:hypothetical protein